MLNKLSAVVHPPTYPDAETNRVARLLFYILTASILIVIFSTISLTFVRYFTSIGIILRGGIFFFVALWFMWRGHLTIASILALTTMAVVIIYLMYYGHGIRDESILIYPLIILFASSLLKRHWYTLFVVALLISAIATTWSQINGLVGPLVASSVDSRQMVTISVVLIITAVTVRFFTEYTSATLKKSIQNEQKLTNLNAQLQEQTLILRQSEAETRQFQEKLHHLQKVSIQLSSVPTLLSLYREAIILGRTHLGFDRLGILLYDKKSNMMVGTFGTDPQGNLRDERTFRRPIEQPEFKHILTQAERTIFRSDTSLFDFGQEVGHGWHAMSVLWGGDEGIGWIATDNLIKQEPPSSLQLEILTLYGSILGNLIARQQKDEELRYSEERHRLLLQTSPIPIVLYDPAGNVLDINHAFTNTFGWQLEEIVGQPLDFVPDESKAETSAAIKNLANISPRNMQQDMAVHFETKRFTKNGELLDVEVSATRIALDGQSWGLVLLQDISEKKQAREALQQHSEQLETMVKARTHALEKAQERLMRQEKLAFLGQLAGGIGHELRNPLGVISNAVYLLNLITEDRDKQVSEYLQLIKKHTQEAEKIITDLLNLSRNRSIERTKTAVPSLILDALDRHPPPDNVTVTTNLANDLPTIYVDADHIRQVFINLITNAYQAMSQTENGTLTITAHTEANTVVITVQDTGTGMSAETAAQVFEPLFTTKAKGIGLGLAVSKNFVEVNNGTLTVTSQKGVGTTFTLTLPQIAMST